MSSDDQGHPAYNLSCTPSSSYHHAVPSMPGQYPGTLTWFPSTGWKALTADRLFFGRQVRSLLLQSVRLLPAGILASWREISSHGCILVSSFVRLSAVNNTDPPQVIIRPLPHAQFQP